MLPKHRAVAPLRNLLVPRRMVTSPVEATRRGFLIVVLQALHQGIGEGE